MSYQSKTTVAQISVGNWNEDTNMTLSTRLNAAYAIAVLIASQCQMDIMGFNTCTSDGDCLLVVIYVNNGCSLADIRRTMAPFVDNRPKSYWMIQDFEEWQGILNCIATVRGLTQEWS